MNYFIYTAIVALAASKSEARIKDNQTNKRRKNISDSEKNVARKAN